jgi:hypothetical protein
LQRVETYLPFMMTIYDNLYDGELWWWFKLTSFFLIA